MTRALPDSVRFRTCIRPSRRTLATRQPRPNEYRRGKRPGSTGSWPGLRFRSQAPSGRRQVSSTSESEMTFAGVVLGVLSGIDVKPRAQAPMVELRRRAVGCDRARITDAIFVSVRRDARHLLPLARWQGESHLGAAGFDSELTDVSGRRRAQEGDGLLRACGSHEAHGRRDAKRRR
jgi:hypothetical protein